MAESPSPSPCPPIEIDTIELIGGPLYPAGATVQAIVTLKGTCCQGDVPYSGPPTITVTLPNDIGVHSNETVWVGPCENQILVGFAPNYAVVAIDRIIVDQSDPEALSPAGVCLQQSITLRAIPDPISQAFPPSYPIWTVVDNPVGVTPPSLADGSATVTFTPTDRGTYVIQAHCGTSSKTFIVNAGVTQRTVQMIMRDPHVFRQSDVTNYPNGPGQIVRTWDVSLRFDCNAPSPVEIKVRRVSGFGAGALSNISNFDEVPDTDTWANFPGNPQFLGVNTSRCTPLANASVPEVEATIPAYVAADNPFPNPNLYYGRPAFNLPGRRMLANGRWFFVQYAVVVNNGVITLTLSATQGPWVANINQRTCP